MNDLRKQDDDNATALQVVVEADSDMEISEGQKSSIEKREYLNRLFKPYPALRDRMLLIFDQSSLSPIHKNAFDKGIEMATASSTDRELFGGVSVDDLTHDQLFNGKKGSGRLEVLIKNCHRMLDGMENRWTPVMTEENIKRIFREVTEEDKWASGISHILQFMRTAFNVRRIEEAAQKMFEVKQAEARKKLGIAPGADLPSDAYSEFQYLDFYKEKDVNAVAVGAMSPEQFSIDSPDAEPQLIEQQSSKTKLLATGVLDKSNKN